MSIKDLISKKLKSGGNYVVSKVLIGIEVMWVTRNSSCSCAKTTHYTNIIIKTGENVIQLTDQHIGSSFIPFSNHVDPIKHVLDDYADLLLPVVIFHYQ